MSDLNIINIIEKFLNKIETGTDNLIQVIEGELAPFKKEINDLYNNIPNYKFDLKEGGGIDGRGGISQIENRIVKLYEQDKLFVEKLIISGKTETLRRFNTLLNISYITKIVDDITTNIRNINITEEVKNLDDIKLNLISKIKNVLKIKDIDLIINVISESTDENLTKIINQLQNPQLKKIIVKFLNMIVQGSKKFESIFQNFEKTIFFKFFVNNPQVLKLGGTTFLILFLIEELIKNEILFDYIINNFFGVDINSEIVNEFKKLTKDFYNKFITPDITQNDIKK